MRSLAVTTSMFVLLLVGFAPGPHAAARDGVDEKLIEEVHRKAREDLLAGFEQHAEWCNSAKLYIERDEVYRRILEIEPDHDKARRGLGYRRDPDGNWKDPDPDRKPSRNYSPAKLKKAAKKLSEALTPYTTRMFAFFDEHAEALSDEQRRRLLDDILTMDPENERAHSLLGHVRDENGWVLEETLTAKNRRRELDALVRSLIKRAPNPEPSEPTAREKELGIDWSVVLATKRFRVLGTVEESEAVRAIQALHVAEEYFQGVFGARASFEQDHTLLLLGNPAQKDVLIDHHPGLSESSRAYVRTLDGNGFPGSDDIGHWATTRPKRIDGIVRIGLGYLFTKEFGITLKHTWAYEGFGLYMTYEIVRTRLNWFSRPAGEIPEEEEALRGRLVKPDAKWMQEALDLLRQEDRPELRSLLGKDVSTFHAEDVLFSYALAAFLIETRPLATPKILRKVGEGGDPGLVLTDVLGMEFEEIEAQILEWLPERR